MTDVERVLRRIAPDRSVASIERLTRGNSKETAIARFDDGADIVVQFTDPETARTEAALLAAISERTTVPVPTLLAHGTVDGRGYLVTEHVDGAELHERFAALPTPTRRRLAHAFGAALAQLHAAFPFASAGAVTADTAGELTTEGLSVEAAFERYATAAVEALPPAFDDLRPAIESMVRAPETTRRPRLFPWDMRPGNAILGPDDGVAAVLDWGEPLAADPGLAVAKVEHLVTRWYGVDENALETAFREGYRSVRPLPTVPDTYRVVAVAASAVDSAGDVTRPGFPERTGWDAVDSHRAWLGEWLDESE